MFRCVCHGGAPGACGCGSSIGGLLRRRSSMALLFAVVRVADVDVDVDAEVGASARTSASALEIDDGVPGEEDDDDALEASGAYFDGLSIGFFFFLPFLSAFSPLPPRSQVLRSHHLAPAPVPVFRLFIFLLLRPEPESELDLHRHVPGGKFTSQTTTTHRKPSAIPPNTRAWSAGGMSGKAGRSLIVLRRVRWCKDIEVLTLARAGTIGEGYRNVGGEGLGNVDFLGVDAGVGVEVWNCARRRRPPGGGESDWCSREALSLRCGQAKWGAIVWDGGLEGDGERVCV